MTLVAQETAPKRTKLSRTFGENLFFLDLLYKVRQISGLALTRNDASPPYSACDAVSIALLTYGYAKSDRAFRELTTHKAHATLRRTYDEIQKATLTRPEDELALTEVLSELAEISARNEEE